MTDLIKWNLKYYSILSWYFHFLLSRSEHSAMSISYESLACILTTVQPKCTFLQVLLTSYFWHGWPLFGQIC
jgi:hypothetical protein